MRKFYLIITAIVMGFAINNTAKSQVFTSGFETWTTTAPIKPTDWFGAKTNISADSATQYTSAPHSGTYAIKLENRATMQRRLTTQPISITSGMVYTITFWVKGHGKIRTGIYTGGSIAATAFHYSSWMVVDTSVWIQKTQYIASDTTSSSAAIILNVKATASDLEDLQIDDVTVTSGAIPTVSIHDIQYTTTSPYESPYLSQILTTGGIVSGIYDYGMFIQSGYGPWSGLFVYDSANIAEAGIVRGDSVTVNGTVVEHLTYTELRTILNVTLVSSGNTLHPAYPVTNINSASESLEGVLVAINNQPCVDTTGLYAKGQWIVYNGTDSTKMGGLLYKYPSAVIGTRYDITGEVYLSTGAIMRVLPRDIDDVLIDATGIDEHNQNYIHIYPNPVSSSINIANCDGIQLIRISNILGENIYNVNVSGNNAAINVSRFNSGIYFISLIKDNAVIETRKFIKQ